MNKLVVYCGMYETKPYKVYEFDSEQNRVLVDGCADCKLCCGYFYQPLVLLPNQDKKLFYQKDGVPSITAENGCKQLNPEIGCICPNEHKPPLCRIYPFRLIGRRVQAHVTCPAVANTPLVKLQEIGIEVAKYLVLLPINFLWQISESTPYIPQMMDLNIQIDISGKEYEIFFAK